MGYNGAGVAMSSLMGALPSRPSCAAKSRMFGLLDASRLKSIPFYPLREPAVPNGGRAGTSFLDANRAITNARPDLNTRGNGLWQLYPIQDLLDARCSASRWGLFALTSISAGAADQITFVSQGGAYQKAQTIAILDPRSQEARHHRQSGQAFPTLGPSSSSQVASGKPIWGRGWTCRPAIACAVGDQGLIEKLDFATIPQLPPPWPEAYLRGV